MQASRGIMIDRAIVFLNSIGRCMGHFFLSPAVVILSFFRVWNRRRT
jgi:hypothetical protein